MNVLPRQRQITAVASLCEGVAVRAVVDTGEVAGLPDGCDWKSYTSVYESIRNQWMSL